MTRKKRKDNKIHKSNTTPTRNEKTFQYRTETEYIPHAINKVTEPSCKPTVLCHFTEKLSRRETSNQVL